MNRPASNSSGSDWSMTTPISRSSTSTLPVSSDDASLEIHPTAARDGALIKVMTPRMPANRQLPHMPCDIVLVIDVSGSMGCNAPVPVNPGEASENYGLSVLDLVKHAALTILETLDDTDRLGIVTFASKAKVIQRLNPMGKRNKTLAKKNIDSMQPIDATNLWHGVLEGVKLFNGEANTGRVPAIFVLTDGMPNHM
jgi:hypothetical protein